MNYGEIKKTDIANGLGVRVSLFVSGCPHHCKGCFNSQTWDFNYGRPFDGNVQGEIINLLAPSYINGLTLLGGEPMVPENQKALLPFLKRVRKTYPEKDIWCYSGYVFEDEILKGDANIPETKEFLSLIDVLVDGRFEEDKKNITLKFRGSENQRIIDVKKSLKQNRTIIKNI
ncbi:MAG: anaerobic ribonucleoside-triphosphate reductase activating protein [Clostridia bacterium]|nr:anaerobic ribonucleoside-triphosphate reductase activating protein [Clostridia bacterium]